MSIYIRRNEEELIKLEFNRFNDEYSCFEFGNTERDEISAFFNYGLKVVEKKDSVDYEIFLFYNEEFAENNIFQVYDTKEDLRIGWMFPIQALISSEHNHVGNEHFLNYAIIAYEKLLMSCSDLTGKIPTYREDGSYTLQDFYDVENTHVLILSKSQTGKISDFNVDNYIPSLYQKGYFFKKGSNIKKIEDSGARLNLKKISADIENNAFIKYLFTEILVENSHHLIKFSMLYQVVELLIEKIFNKELKLMLDQLSREQKNLFQVKDDLGKLSKESDRIVKLFNTYTREDGSKSQLLMLCNEFLVGVNRDKKKNAAEALYSVRNVYVHEYRSIDTSNIALIDDINEVFEKVIIEILHDLNGVK
ncbi:hypothetical protein [Bacillus cereus]|uniref:hypothetical protein n=1 Tax=Bacillus cereus TaxID=1396 RepID=UPI000279E3BD|nr:hypothetical protein [Bacillus cereus]EJS02223.1 hypothetical protein IKG_01127 [Bacillus cereus VD200]